MFLHHDHDDDDHGDWYFDDNEDDGYHYDQDDHGDGDDNDDGTVGHCSKAWYKPACGWSTKTRKPLLKNYHCHSKDKIITIVIVMTKILPLS